MNIDHAISNNVTDSYTVIDWITQDSISVLDDGTHTLIVDNQGRVIKYEITNCKFMHRMVV